MHPVVFWGLIGVGVTLTALAIYGINRRWKVGGSIANRLRRVMLWFPSRTQSPAIP